MVLHNVSRCLPIRQAILNISQLAVTFHGIRPPIFIQIWLQQYRTHPFLNSAYCSFSIPICFWTVRGWRTMMPRKIFTSLTKLQGVVSVNDFWFSGRFQELLQAPFCFLWSLCFARIILNPLSSQVLHHHSISMIVFEILNLIQEFRDPMLSSHPNFLHEVRLYQYLFCMEPL